MDRGISLTVPTRQHGGATTFDAVEMFNPLTGLWNNLGVVPAMLSGITAATGDSVNGERIYLFGGSASANGTQVALQFRWRNPQ